MAWTQATYISNTRAVMDATSSTRWSDTDVKVALGFVHANEYSSLLSANPYVKLQQVSVTTDANGQFLVTTMDTGSGDTKKWFFRMIALTDGNVVYRPTSFRQVPVATTTNYVDPYQRLYYQAGDYVQVLPVTAGLSLYAWTNWTPTPIDQLAGTSSTVDFPDNSEMLVCYGAAAFLLNKAGAESEASGQMKAMANELRTQMYQNLSRFSAQPIYMGYPDLAGEWGGATGAL